MKYNNDDEVIDDIYNPSDARMECFGVEMSVRNRDREVFERLWNRGGGGGEGSGKDHIYSRV